MSEAIPLPNPPAVSRDELLKFERDLPSLPASVSQIMRLANDPNSDSSELTVAVSGDASLSSQVLRLANSALFAQQGRVKDVQQAVGLIGLTHLKTIAMAKAAASLQPDPMPADKLVRDHGIATGVAMLVIAERMQRRDADQLFLYGLLHRLGQFVMLAHPLTRDRYPDVIAFVRDHEVDCLTAELKVLGVSHPWLGGMLARRWSFPLDLVHVLLHYPRGGDGSDAALDEITNLVRFADLVATASGRGTFPGHPSDEGEILELGHSLGVFADARPSQLANFLVEMNEKWAAAQSVWPG